jgi:hypothetical protein
MKKINNELVSLNEIETLIDENLFSSYEEETRLLKTRNLLSKYLKFEKNTIVKLDPRHEAYDPKYEGYRFKFIRQTNQRKRRMNYLNMISDNNIKYELLDQFIQKGCLGDLKYLDRVLYMIDSRRIDIKDVEKCLEKNIPIIDHTIKINNNFKSYCENQNDSLQDRLGKQKTI